MIYSAHSAQHRHTTALGRCRPGNTVAHHPLPSTAPVGGLSDTSRPGYPGLPDASQWLTWFTDNPVTRCLTHPVVAVFQFAGVFFGVYFTGLFDVLTAEHAGHVGLVAISLPSGVLFFWSFISKNSPPLGDSARNPSAASDSQRP